MSDLPYRQCLSHASDKYFDFVCFVSMVVMCGHRDSSHDPTDYAVVATRDDPYWASCDHCWSTWHLWDVYEIVD